MVLRVPAVRPAGARDLRVRSGLCDGKVGRHDTRTCRNQLVLLFLLCCSKMSIAPDGRRRWRAAATELRATGTLSARSKPDRLSSAQRAPTSSTNEPRAMTTSQMVAGRRRAGCEWPGACERATRTSNGARWPVRSAGTHWSRPARW